MLFWTAEPMTAQGPRKGENKGSLRRAKPRRALDFCAPFWPLVLATGASGGNTKRSAKKTGGLPAGLDGVAPYQNTARKANCIVRAPPAVVMTPKVAWSLRLV